MPRLVRIATRSSPLAQWQARHVADLIHHTSPGIAVELVPMSTEGDRRTDVPLSLIGGKGVFAKEVQAAVIDGRADLAVHSAKDLPALTPDALVIGAVPERGDPRDALVGCRLVDLPTDGVIATGSARRRVQLGHLRPDLVFAELRGNMATRLAKADEFAAIVVAAVAFERLGLVDRLTEVLPTSLFVPQVGQGALAVECRADDGETRELLGRIEHGPSRRTLDAERAFLTELGGDCSLPAGAHAEVVTGGGLRMRAILAADERGPVVRHEATGDDGVELGRAVAMAIRAAL